MGFIGVQGPRSSPLPCRGSIIPLAIWMELCLCHALAYGVFRYPLVSRGIGLGITYMTSLRHPTWWNPSSFGLLCLVSLHSLPCTCTDLSRTEGQIKRGKPPRLSMVQADSSETRFVYRLMHATPLPPPHLPEGRSTHGSRVSRIHTQNL